MLHLVDLHDLSPLYVQNQRNSAEIQQKKMHLFLLEKQKSWCMQVSIGGYDTAQQISMFDRNFQAW